MRLLLTALCLFFLIGGVVGIPMTAAISNVTINPNP